MFANGNSFGASPASAEVAVRMPPSILVRVTGGPLMALPQR